MKKLAIFVALLTLSITNAFITSHLIKLLIAFSTSVKIMRCTFIVQNNKICNKIIKYVIKYCNKICFS